MRIFNKYWVEPGKGKEFRSIEKSFESHSSAMGGYEVDESYKSKNVFLEKWFRGRHVSYDSFVKKFISKNENILSIASGRCINELKLIDEGYNITCSDLVIPSCYIPAKDLFGEFEFIKLDILKEVPSKIYGKIICISLIWAFNKDEMNVFFKNIHNGLDNGGIAIVELSVSPDNLLSFLFHDIYLRCESNVLRIIAPVFGRSLKRIKEIHGYRYSTKEIIQIASENHFKLVDILACEPLLEFQRSPLFCSLIEKSDPIKKVLTIIGSLIPYSRIFALSKI